MINNTVKMLIERNNMNLGLHVLQNRGFAHLHTVKRGYLFVVEPEI